MRKQHYIATLCLAILTAGFFPIQPVLSENFEKHFFKKTPGELPPTPITGNLFPCPGSTEQYSVPFLAGASWSWSISGGGGIVSSNANSVVVRWTAPAGSDHELRVIETNALGAATTYIAEIGIRETHLVCNDTVRISISDRCRAYVHPDEVLEGSYQTYAGYQVTLKPKSAGAQAVKDTVIGPGVYEVKVIEPCLNNSCWGIIVAEDKQPPTFNCVLTSVACSHADTSAQIPNLSGRPTFAVIYGGIGNVVVNDNCGLQAIWHVDEFHDVNCTDFNGVLSAYVIRHWFARDIYGNVGSCDQEIRFIRQPISNVNFPADITFSCENADTTPAAAGVPRVAGWPLYPSSFFCEMNAGYKDNVIPVCDGTYKILRTWTVLDWCQPLNRQGTPSFNPHLPPNPRVEIQVIKVLDNQGPVFACPGDQEADSNTADCNGNVDLPDVIVTDACSRINSAQAVTPNGVLTGTITTFPGNNLWLPDTMVRFGTVSNLPPGDHLITYTITDDCNNQTTCTFNLHVGDNTPPNAVCDEFTKVSLGANGTSLVDAKVFDDGSWDNCGSVWFKARKMDIDACGNGDDLFFKDKLTFCCAELGKQLTIIVRVYDEQPNPGFVTEDHKIGHYDDCMVFVKPEDKLKPECIPPANTTVNCDAFDPTLWPYGQPIITDNCGVANTSITLNYNDFDTVCNRGTIYRTFVATDNFGNVGKCTQRVVVRYEANFSVKFPDDRTITQCNAQGIYGEPIVNGKDCELMATSFTDQVFNLVPDACFKILRTWRVIDWCSFDANDAPYVVPNPQNIDIGPIVYASPSNHGNFQYTQILKFIDNEKPVVLNCPTGGVHEVLDLTPNDPTLFKHPNYWDDVHQSHDLCEAPIGLSITATDACSKSNVLISYSIQLDLDGDGTYDQTILTGQPGSGLLFETTDSLRKTATFHPDYQLPHGKHKFTWVVKDGCGNTTNCHFILHIRDGKAPTVACINGLSVNIMPTKMIALWASDFIQYAEDNCTPADQLVFGIRKSHTGSGFPLDVNGQPLTGVTFDCNELGTQTVEVWAKDKAGNASYCETYVIIQDNSQACSTTQATISGMLQTEEIEGVQEAFVKISGSNNALPSPGMMSKTDGSYNFNALPLGQDYKIAPEKDYNWLNGVSTFDLLLISKHITGTSPLNSPYKIIAADADRSGRVTGFDVVQLRKLILGVEDSIAGNTSWRFISKKQPFADPLDPFKTPVTEAITVADLHNNMADGDFVGVKVGDVNLSARANNLMTGDDRNRAGTLHFDIADRYVKPGETVAVRFYSSELAQILGFQFALAFDPASLECTDITPGSLPDMSRENFGTLRLPEGLLTGSWNTTYVSSGKKLLFTLHFKVKKDGKLSKLLQLSHRITPTEAYSRQGEMLDVNLRFQSKKTTLTEGVGLELYQNEPNPFSEKTTVGFNLPEAGKATLSILDGSGKVLHRVKGNFEKGYNSISLDKSVIAGSGILYYRLDTSTGSEQRKMVLVNR